MSRPAITVAVVSWNTRDLLRRCLASLRLGATAGRIEVWVVDNGSTDGSRELVEREFPWAILHASERNLGFGPAVNLVFERSTSEWIAAANADVAVAPDALDAMLEAGRSADVGAVAPRLVMPDGAPQHSVHPFPGLGLGVIFNLGLARLVPGLGERLCLPGHWSADRRRDVDWALGALLLIRRSAFAGVGGFDPRQWMYAEDLDLCWRLGGGGWRIVYEPAAEVLHEVSAAAREAFAGDLDRRHLEASYLWMARRRGATAARAYAALNIAGAAARGLLLAPFQLAAPARFGPGRRRVRAYVDLHRAAAAPLLRGTESRGPTRH